MKIAFFSDCYLDLTGGIVSAINTEKAALEARGHTVYVFSSSYPKSEKERARLAKQNIFPVKSCRVLGRGISPITRRPRVVEKDIIRRFPEIINFDIYYIHYEAGCSIAGLRLGKQFNIPTIQVMHGREDMGVAGLIPFGLRTFVASALNLFHSWYIPHPVKVKKDDYLADTIFKAKMWTLMVNHANYADLVITPSEHFRAKLMHYGVTKPVIALHHGVADDLLAEPVVVKELATGERLELIWHSRVSGEKRPLVLLQALSMLDSFRYHLSMYGDGPELSKCRRFAARHHLNVTFHGAAKFPTIWRALKKSHLDILISYNYDTFGMTLIEAAAAGVPVLFCDPDMTEISPTGSFVLAADSSAQEIAATLKQIIDHPAQISAMSRKAISARSHLKISTKIQNLEKIIKSMLQN